MFNHIRHVIPSVQRLDESGLRVYQTPTGEKYPSVTTVLGSFGKEGLEAWKRKVGYEQATKIANQAANRGTKFHQICESYLSNITPTFKTPLEQQLFINTKKYLDKIDNIHLLEQGLFSHHLRMAGTVDCVADFEGKLSVIDFKTANRPKDKDHIENYFLQATAYAIMFEERTKIPAPQIVIIIAVEGEPSQLFVERRNNFAKKLLQYRNAYEGKND